MNRMNRIREIKENRQHILAAVIIICCILFLAGCTGENGDAQNADFSPHGSAVSIDKIPEYSGEPYIEINGNEPYFEDADLTTKAFEEYSALDGMGRCGVAYACIGRELMPTEERGSIGMIKPSGWHTVKYDNVDGKYLYNRCHLIGYQLTAENANEKNLITGTRYLNIKGMLPFENEVADYVKETNNHVLFRATPIYDGDNLLPSGVLMEALSVEDESEGLKFNIYAYNVQPGIDIDHRTGESHTDGQKGTTKETTVVANGESGTYIININSGIFHKPECASVSKMADKNKEQFSGKRSVLTDQGLKPCGNCLY